MAWLNRLWVRLWLLAVSSIATALTLLFAIFLSFQLWLEHVIEVVIPPAARVELSRLEASGEIAGLRYDRLYERYILPYAPLSDIQLGALSGFIAAVGAGALALLIARRISQPISAVAKAAEDIAAGRLEARADARGGSGETALLVDRFNVMAEELERYERERAILTAGIAHELRTPLTALKWRLHAILDGIVPLAPGEAAKALVNAEQLSLLVDDLRMVAFAAVGELTIDIRVIDVREVASQVVEDLRAIASEVDVRLDLDGEAVQALGDTMRVTQVLTNLMTNAIKHSPSGATVRIRTTRSPALAVVTVEDAGGGFDEAHHEAMFRPFWRAEVDKGTARRGSGLGLTLAASLAAAQGGRIIAANRPEGGAQFRLELKLASAG